MVVNFEDGAHLNIAHLGQLAVSIVESMGFDNGNRCFVDGDRGFAHGKGRLAPPCLSIVHLGSRHIDPPLKSSADTSGI